MYYTTEKGQRKKPPVISKVLPTLEKGAFHIYMKDYNTNQEKSQEQKILKKILIKKKNNEKVINWLLSERDNDRAERLRECATYLGITNINGITKIIKSNFCREKICNICAWRRQSKFVAQMLPVLQYLSNDYEFIFATLTVKNTPYEELSATIDKMLRSFKKLIDRRKIKRVWQGITRSIEITYNEKEDTFHPHIHLLIAVKPDYFNANNPDYITQKELCDIWKDTLKVDYMPICDIRKISDESGAAVETLKYSLKPTPNEKALSAFLYCLHHKRLVSFTGIFAKARKTLKYSSIDDLEDDIPTDIKDTNINYKLFKFDVTGGVYTYYQTLEMRL